MGLHGGAPHTLNPQPHWSQVLDVGGATKNAEWICESSLEVIGGFNVEYNQGSWAKTAGMVMDNTKVRGVVAV